MWRAPLRGVVHVGVPLGDLGHDGPTLTPNIGGTRRQRVEENHILGTMKGE